MVLEEKEISLESCLSEYRDELGHFEGTCGKTLSLCAAIPAHQGSPESFPAHTELQLLVLTCNNALQCQVKNAAALCMFCCENPAQPADPREHWDGDLPTQHVAQVKQKSIKGHQNAGNYFLSTC